jgi:glycosyltransferase involved in cell wall biosynthesis
MPDSRFVSVIIPVYNGEEFLTDAIESVRRQHFTALEIIVVDDGSTDRTPAIALGLGSEVRYLRQPNRGPPAARNSGLLAARGDVIAFLDADDLWAPGRLQRLLARLDADPRADVVIGHTQLITAGGETGTAEPRLCSPPFCTLALWSGLIRTGAFDRVGKLDESLRHSDDTDWFLRAQEIGVPMAAIPEVTQFYRKHGGNITNRREVDRQYMLAALKKSLDRRRRVGTAATSLSPWFTTQGRAGAPLVSVVIPVYNGQDYLRAAIHSVLAQDYRPLEVVVVDDGSRDDSAAIAQSFPDVRYLHQENQGHAAAKNTGISAARGELIAFLDADDLWEPGKLTAQVAYLSAHPEAGAVVCRQRIFQEPGTTLPAWLEERLARDRISGAPPAFIPSALLVRRAALNKVGTFNTGYRHGNDSDWFFRARDAEVTVAVVPDVLIARRFHAANLSRETDAMQGDLLRVVKASFDRRRAAALRDGSPPA